MGFYEAVDMSRAAGRAGAQMISDLWLPVAASHRQMAQVPMFPLNAWFEMSARAMTAGDIMLHRAFQEFPKPEFGLNSTVIDGKEIAVEEEISLSKPYGDLVRFKRDTDRDDPAVLLVAPMSGHYATLLRGTVKSLLPAHDVHITDWANARDVPEEDGDFGFDTYVHYVEDFIRHLSQEGRKVHVVAVCQPTVPVIAALARMAKAGDPALPLSVTLKGGPIDPGANETSVTQYGASQSLDNISRFEIMRVPDHYKGAGQLVKPAFLQLAAFKGMNADTHAFAKMDQFRNLMFGRDEAAEKSLDFYDEYEAVADIPGRFFLETFDFVFNRRLLPKGELEIDGERIDPGDIRDVTLFTVEGDRDDISAKGQTDAAQTLCRNIPVDRRFSHLQSEAGHYGIFSGSRYRDQIVPRITAVIRGAAEKAGITHSPVPDEAMKQPILWKLNKACPKTWEPHPG
jgi:poly(3-hydroxybutyrate) depolymerase